MPDINITFNILDHFDIEEITEEITQYMANNIQGLAYATRDEWIRRANMNLNTTRNDYVSSIQKVKNKGNNVFRIELVGESANARCCLAR